MEIKSELDEIEGKIRRDYEEQIAAIKVLRRYEKFLIDGSNGANGANGAKYQGGRIEPMAVKVEAVDPKIAERAAKKKAYQKKWWAKHKRQMAAARSNRR